ncbi:MAG: hypothetical protein ABSA91_01095 [Acidimicrobiales bacterium]
MAIACQGGFEKCLGNIANLYLGLGGLLRSGGHVTSDTRWRELVTGIAGEVDMEVSSRTVSRGWHKQASTTWSPRRQPRLPVDVVARGKPGTALLISGTRLSQVWLPPLPAHATDTAPAWTSISSVVPGA